MMDNPSSETPSTVGRAFVLDRNAVSQMKNGLRSHNGIARELLLRDDRVKFVAGDEEYERKMKLMSNCART